MLTKVCGITLLKDALLAEAYGAWAIGFNFVPSSPRYITPEKAQPIIAQLSPQTLKIGVFAKCKASHCLHIIQQLKLDYAQVYEEFDLPPFQKAKLILSIKPHTFAEVPSLDRLREYAYVLIDAPSSKDDPLGGTGKLAIWPIAQSLIHSVKLILAGGLKPDTVQTAITTVQPFAVDVCSGIELAPGIKNPDQLHLFLRRANLA